MLRKRPEPAPPVLSPGIVMVVLCGWAALPVGSGHDDAVFQLFMDREAGVVSLWRRHEVFLRSEAKRLNIRPTCGHKEFFGEYLARRPDAQRVAITPDDDAA